jgi:hypothetical protein
LGNAFGEDLEKAARHANVDVETAADDIHSAAKKPRDSGRPR